MAVSRRRIEAEQFEFTFPTASHTDSPWRVEWKRRAMELCERLALPLNHPAEVRLARGRVLKGKLTLAEDQLFPDERNRPILMIGGTSFQFGEIASMVRLD